MTIIVDQTPTPSSGIRIPHTSWCDVAQHELEHADDAAGYSDPSEAPVQPCRGPERDIPMGGAVFLVGEPGQKPTVGWLNDPHQGPLTLEDIGRTAAVLSLLEMEAQTSVVAFIPRPGTEQCASTQSRQARRSPRRPGQRGDRGASAVPVLWAVATVLLLACVGGLMVGAWWALPVGGTIAGAAVLTMLFGRTDLSQPSIWSQLAQLGGKVLRGRRSRSAEPRGDVDRKVVAAYAVTSTGEVSMPSTGGEVA